MVPPSVTKDYYMILKVERTAPLELIKESYKKLAMKLHPDRNPKINTTKAFQELSTAYEVLKDKSKRRDYDRSLPPITRTRPSSQTTQKPRPPPASTSQPARYGEEVCQIAAIHKLWEERQARWLTKKSALDSSIFELHGAIRKLEQDVKSFNITTTPKVAEESQKNSWGARLSASRCKKAEESEEEKERRNRQTQERRIEKDMKERRLSLRKEEYKKRKSQLTKAQREVDAMDLADWGRVHTLQDAWWARVSWERQEIVNAGKAWKWRNSKQETRYEDEQELADILRDQFLEKEAAAEHAAAERLRREYAEAKARAEGLRRKFAAEQAATEQAEAEQLIRTCAKWQAVLEQQRRKYAELQAAAKQLRRKYAEGQAAVETRRRKHAAQNRQEEAARIQRRQRECERGRAEAPRRRFEDERAAAQQRREGEAER